MTEHTDEKTGGSAWLGVLLVVVAIALVLAGLVAYYVLTAQPTPVRVGLLLLAAALGVGVFALSPLGKTTWAFALGSRVELRKMVWPTGRDTRVTTAIVFVFVVVLGLFFWVVDWLLAYGTRHLLGTGA
jgi:preprotein translocase subunit SecE